MTGSLAFFRDCLQVDGPSHFAANVPNRPLGPTVARDRCLTQLEGLALVVVPWFEWGALRVRASGGAAAGQQRGRVVLLGGL